MTLRTYVVILTALIISATIAVQSFALVSTDFTRVYGFNEESGTYGASTGAEGRNVSYNNTPTLNTSGLIRKGISFPQVNGIYVTIPNSISVNSGNLTIGSTDAFSFGLWVNCSTKPTNFSDILRKYATVSTHMNASCGILSTGRVRCGFWLASGSASYVNGTSDVCNSQWHWIAVTKNTGAQYKLYIDNVEEASGNASGTSDVASIVLGGFNGIKLSVDTFMFNLSEWDSTIRSTAYNAGIGTELYDAKAVGLSNYNCTSCNPPAGDTSAPYTTTDTTPTFTFTSNINAICRIGATDVNYSSMGSSRQCAGGEGTTYHTCTLTSQDALTYPTSNAYVSCIDIYTDTYYQQQFSSSSGALAMDVEGLSGWTPIAIDEGIHMSEVWPGATVYSDQSVFLRDLDNNQVLATADRVVAYGSQRWILNHADVNESLPALFNLTPAVYVWNTDAVLTPSEVARQVSEFINNTKA